MAIANYNDLKAVLSHYMFHQRFVPDYDTATINFESSINRRLSVRPMETWTVLQTNADANSELYGMTELPTDYLTWRTVLWMQSFTVPTAPGSSPRSDETVELDYVHPAYLNSTDAGVAGGQPKIFTIEGNWFKVRSYPASGSNLFEFHYYAILPSILSSPNTNWLLQESPDAYLFGVLVELFSLGRHIEAATLYKQRRDEVLGEIISGYADGTGATSKLVREAEYF